MKKGEKKRWMLVIGIACSALAVTSCARVYREQRPKKREAEAKIPLVIWAWDETFNVKAARLAEKRFEEVYSDVDVQVVAMDQNEILDKLTTNLSSRIYGNLPDIVLLEDYRSQKYFLKFPNEFVPLGEYIDFTDFLEYKNTVVSIDGTQYGVPFDCGTAVLFYRKDYIEEAGFQESDMENLTWGEYIEIGKKVKEETGHYMLTVEPNDLGMMRMMMQSAGKWYVNADGTEVDLEENEALHEAVEIYQEMIDTGITYSIYGWEEFVNSFQSGSVATVASGCWAVSSIKEAQEQTGQWRAVSIPRLESVEDSVNRSNLGGSSWYVIKEKGHVETAIKFLRTTFCDVEFLNEIVREVDVVSANQKVTAQEELEDEFFGGQKIMKLFGDMSRETPVVNYGIATYEIEDIFAEEIQNMIVNGNMEEAFHNAQIKASALMR